MGGASKDDTLASEQSRGVSDTPARALELRGSPRVGLKLGGRYRILGLLDEGATAEVYLAEDSKTGRQLVVKWLTTLAARDTQLRERFLVGGRAAMSVTHPAVALVHCVEAPNEMPPYLVMEALFGEPLSDYLERIGPMPQSLVLSLVRDAASGLLAAHQLGIIHRDIKPGNLFLVGEKGSPKCLKLIDFGLAKDTRNGGAGPSSNNIVMGTGQYMAPEQVLADTVDPRTDVYALGVVMFRMLTGQLPFDLDPGIDLFSHQLFSPAPPPSWLVEAIHPGLEQLVMRCMRKHPENRYPSMSAVLAELDAITRTDSTQWERPAPEPLAREPDVYNPRNAKGRGVAEFLAAYFGSEPPPPPSVELSPGFEPESSVR